MDPAGSRIQDPVRALSAALGVSSRGAANWLAAPHEVVIHAMIGPGSELGPYIVIKPLGAGAMGAVYRAHDRRLGREVALKLLPAEFATDPYRLALFRREALALASLNHPGIATIHGFEEPEPGVTFLVLELVEGQSLGERLQRERISTEEALRIGARIAEALEAAHERGIIHRDLKPGNIMLGPKGTVKVLDFGLARSLKQAWREEKYGEVPDEAPGRPPASGPVDSTVIVPPADVDGGVSPPDPASPGPMDDDTVIVPGPSPPSPDETLVVLPAGDDDDTMVGTEPGASPRLADSFSIDEGVAGTPGYMSPEQILARTQDARTDIFAFGCVLYVMLTGQPAFGGSSLQEVFNATLLQDPDLTALPSRLPPRIRALVAECLQREVVDRLSDIRTARTELEEALGIRRAAAMLAGEAAAHPNNLPAAPNELVGREAEVASCLEHLEKTRLLTLTGMGGTGKTRVALHLAREVLDAYPDGAWLVDLSSLTKPERVVTALATVMELHEEPGKSTIQTLLDHLAERRILIVLDNCEHLVEACATTVGQILGATAEVRVLATSREALAIPEETTFPVPTLALPEADTTDGKTLRESASVRLFVERAVQAKPGFELTDAILPIVADICRRLDGIPLAIELAAARVKVLDAEKIRAKLDDRFRLLTGGSRAALPRQQTLRATMQWSYDHLASLEQQLFRALSVFAGGWTLESAAAIWEDDADEFEVLDLLTRLIDKSLVVTRSGRDGENRYVYLETVRQYGVEQRDAEGEGPNRGGRLIRHVRGLVERSESKLVGPEQKIWLDRLDDEQGNLLAALRWCEVIPEAAGDWLRIAGAAARYWSTRGRYEIAEHALREALDHGDSAEATPERAKALVRLGGMMLYHGDYAEARIPIEESLAVYRALGDDQGAARSLSGLSTVATYQQDYEAAERYGKEVLAFYRERGGERGLGVTLHNLGFMMFCRGEAEAAAGYFEESLPHLDKAGDLQHVALALTSLAMARARLDQPAVAAAQLIAALEIVRDLDAHRGGAYAVAGAAVLASQAGETERAVRWHGAAEAIRADIGISLAPDEQREWDTFRDELRSRLDESLFASCLGEGAALEFLTVLEETRVWVQSLDTGAL